jgi:hypothetical protein
LCKKLKQCARRGLGKKPNRLVSRITRLKMIVWCKKPKQCARRGLGKKPNRLVSRVYMYDVFVAHRLTLFDLKRENPIKYDRTK